MYLSEVKRRMEKYDELEEQLNIEVEEFKKKYRNDNKSDYDNYNELFDMARKNYMELIELKLHHLPGNDEYERYRLNDKSELKINIYLHEHSLRVDVNYNPHREGFDYYDYYNLRILYDWDVFKEELINLNREQKELEKQKQIEELEKKIKELRGE